MEPRSIERGNSMLQKPLGTVKSCFNGATLIERGNSLLSRGAAIAPSTASMEPRSIERGNRAPERKLAYEVHRLQ